MFFDYQSVKSAPPEALERTNKNARLPQTERISAPLKTLECYQRSVRYIIKKASLCYPIQFQKLNHQA